ncbi:MAG: histidinol-phosphatase [Desulfocapsaceae bacterium]|nr:histidinol-phosphatase [Desulfocapsaceae bacterium]
MDIDVSLDGHVHTHLCMHAGGTMEEYVQSAIAGGLRHLVFLEHLEEGIDYFERTWLEEDDFDLYFAEGQRLRQKYGEIIKIGLGVEVGYNPSCPDKILERLATRSWDRIGISYHFYRLPGNGGHLNFLSRQQENIKAFLKNDVSQLLSHYFKTLIEAVQVIPADVLCHLDAGLRHVPGLRLNSEHRDLIDRLLQQLKEKRLTLELNTSGYESRDMPFPAFDLIQKAAQLDIPMTAGSDAHLPSQVGRHFKRLAEDLTGLSR